MGEVYRARDPELGRDVAIKVLPAELTADRDRLDRFVREARLPASLNHPHVVTIHAIETTSGIEELERGPFERSTSRCDGGDGAPPLQRRGWCRAVRRRGRCRRGRIDWRQIAQR